MTATLEKVVADLPDTAEGIAAMLREADIKGDHQCRTCPLAVWLSMQVGEPVTLGSPCCTMSGATVWLPPAAREFVGLFDGQLPLVLPSWPELEVATDG